MLRPPFVAIFREVFCEEFVSKFYSSDLHACIRATLSNAQVILRPCMYQGNNILHVKFIEYETHTLHKAILSNGLSVSDKIG